jgi:hypothetical protein
MANPLYFVKVEFISTVSESYPAIASAPQPALSPAAEIRPICENRSCLTFSQHFSDEVLTPFNLLDHPLFTTE